jgi:hypothetical protein
MARRLHRRLPGVTDLISRPISSTIPQYSCPIGSPGRPGCRPEITDPKVIAAIVRLTRGNQNTVPFKSMNTYKGVNPFKSTAIYFGFSPRTGVFYPKNVLAYR